MLLYGWVRRLAEALSAIVVPKGQH
jgi:hypothetical protein